MALTQQERQKMAHGIGVIRAARMTLKELRSNAQRERERRVLEHNDDKKLVGYLLWADDFWARHGNTPLTETERHQMAEDLASQLDEGTRDDLADLVVARIEREMSWLPDEELEAERKR